MDELKCKIKKLKKYVKSIQQYSFFSVDGNLHVGSNPLFSNGHLIGYIIINDYKPSKINVDELIKKNLKTLILGDNKLRINKKVVAVANKFSNESWSGSTNVESASTEVPLISVSQPTNFYTSILENGVEYIFINVKDIECNLFVKYDMSDDYVLNCICIGGGGGGSGAKYADGNPYSNGGGAGGAIAQFYNYSSKAGDMISMQCGSKGIGGQSSYNGYSGNNSYLKYYDTNINNKNNFVITSYGGGGGSTTTRGYTTDPLILLCPKNGEESLIPTDENTHLKYRTGNGGNGGDQSPGTQSIFIYDSIENLTGQNFKIYKPTNLTINNNYVYDSYSGGGGGACFQNDETNYCGGGAGSMKSTTYNENINMITFSNGCGGFLGSSENFEYSIQTDGYTALTYGSGGGAGGIDIANDSKKPGGSGDDGLILLFVKARSDGTSWFSSSYSNKTTNFNYTIISSNPKDDTTSSYTYAITPNSTIEINSVIVGSGGGGGASYKGTTNGGGGGGGYCLVKYNPTDNNNKMGITVGNTVNGGNTGDSQEKGEMGVSTIFSPNINTSDLISASGGNPGDGTARGLGGTATASGSIKIYLSGVGGEGGDNNNPGKDGNGGLTIALFNQELLDLNNSLMINRYSGGGSAGKGNNESGKNYPAGMAGQNNGKGGIRDNTTYYQKPYIGLINSGIGGGGGAGGYESDQTEFGGGKSNSGICVLYYKRYY